MCCLRNAHYKFVDGFDLSEAWDSLTKKWENQKCFRMTLIFYNSVHDEMQTRARWQVRKCVSYPVKVIYFPCVPKYCTSSQTTKNSLYSCIVGIQWHVYQVEGNTPLLSSLCCHLSHCHTVKLSSPKTYRTDKGTEQQAPATSFGWRQSY